MEETDTKESKWKYIVVENYIAKYLSFYFEYIIADTS